MSQYTTGTVSVTNGSAAIVGTGTAWLANAAAGNVFIVSGSGVPYVLGSVTDNTHATLSSNYAGTTASAQPYSITTSSTPNQSLPYPEDGDIDTATIFKRAMLLIDTLLNYVTLVDAAADTTTWPMLATSQTGSQQPTTDAGLTYNASTNLLTSGEFRSNGTSGGLEIANANSTDSYQASIGGSMSLDAASLNGLSMAVTFTGGVSLTSARGALLNNTFNPATNAVITNLYNQFVLNNGASPANVYANYSAFILGSGALGGTIPAVYGNLVQFTSNAAATTNVDVWASYHAANIANGALQTVTSARSFSGGMSAGTGRRNLYMNGTAVNYLNGALMIGSDTDDTVNKLQVTGSIKATTIMVTGGYLVATLPAGVTGARAYVTDATAPTWLAALTGGGAVKCPVFYNSTAWVSA